MLCHIDEPVALGVSVYCHGGMGVDPRDDIKPKHFYIWSCRAAWNKPSVLHTAHFGFLAFAGLPKTRGGRSVSPERRPSASRRLRVSKLLPFHHACEIYTSCGL